MNTTKLQRESLKELRKKLIELNSNGYSKKDTCKANILYHLYIDNGGKRLVKINSLKYILKTLELRSIYQKAKLNSTSKFNTLDDVIRFSVFKFWKVAYSGGIDMNQPHVKVYSNGGYETVEIMSDAVVNGRVMHINIVSTIENEDEGYNITDLLCKLMYTTNELFGGTKDDFELLLTSMKELGYNLVGQIYIKM